MPLPKLEEDQPAIADSPTASTTAPISPSMAAPLPLTPTINPNTSVGSITNSPTNLAAAVILTPQDISSHAQTAYKIAMKEIRFVCPCCSRSKKPKYADLLPLLRSLSKLPLHTVEGEVFRYLTERYLKWEDYVTKLLCENEEIKKILEIWRNDPQIPGNIFHTRLHRVAGEIVMVRVESFREVVGVNKITKLGCQDYLEKPYFGELAIGMTLLEICENQF